MSSNQKRPRTDDEDTVQVAHDGYLMLPDFDPVKCNPYNSIRDYNNSPNTYPIGQRRAQALRFALNINEFDLDIEAIVHMVGLTCHCLDAEFQWVKMRNNLILHDTALTSTKLSLQQIEEYATKPETVEYYNKKMIRWTMFIVTKEFFIGGYLFNWLRNMNPRQSIRSSPNIGLYSSEIAWFTFTTMFTINKDAFNKFLEEEVFDKPCQYHTFEKKFNLRDNGMNCDWTKGWCLEVPEHEADYATERVFRKLPNGDSVWSQFAPSIIPVPLQLNRNNSTQLQMFNVQKRWYMRGFSKIFVTFNSTPISTVDLELIKYITKAKHPENDKVFIVKTAALFGDRYILTCWQVDDPIVRDLLLTFINDNNIAANIGRPARRQQFRNQWASLDTQSIISDLDTASINSTPTNIVSPVATRSPPQSSLSVASHSSRTSILKTPSPQKNNKGSNESSIREIVRDEIRDPLKKVHTKLSTLTKGFNDMQKNNNLLQKYQESIKEQQSRINAAISRRQDTLDSTVTGNSKKIKLVADTFNTLVHDHNQWTQKLHEPVPDNDDLSTIHPPQYRTINFDTLDDASDTSMVGASDSEESKSTTKSPSDEGHSNHD